MAQAFELSEAQITQITTFIQETMLDNEEWDAGIQQFSVLVDTQAGQKFVVGALNLLTLQAEDDDLTQNCELVAAAMALGFVPPTPFFQAIAKVPRLKNKSAIEKIMLKISKFNAASDSTGNTIPCPKCNGPRIEGSIFCPRCGIKLSAASPPQDMVPADAQQEIVSAISAPISNAFSQMITAMAAQTQLLKQLTDKGKKHYYSGAEDYVSEMDDESLLDTDMPSLWKEPIATAQECSKIQSQHNYALQQYVERSMATTAMLIEKIKGIGPKMSKEERHQILLSLSQSLRDQLFSYHVPGSRPIECEKKALCCSLLKGRLPAKELERVASQKPKYVAPKPPKDEAATKEKGKPLQNDGEDGTKKKHK